MKRLVWLGVFVVLTGNCFGQRPAGFRNFPAGRVFENRTFRGASVSGVRFPFQEQISINSGISPLSAISPLGVNQLGVDLFTASLPGASRRFGSAAFSPFGAYPLLPVFGEGYGAGYAGPPSIIVLQPIQMALPQPVRPQIARPALHEYKEAAEASSVTGGAQPMFTLALRDGSRQPAILVWVQEGVVHYIDQTGKTSHIPLDTLDRDTTQRLNREKNLELHLPMHQAT
jgi:hypothetical protein